MIKLGTVNISEKTKQLMQEALDSGMIGQGKYIEEFEKKLADFLGVKYALAVSSGTMADACALAAIKEKDNSERNEVIVTALTFVAQINAIYYNHLKPVFVDAGYDYQIDVSKIEEKITSRTLAIMPTHLLGKSCNMKKIMELAKKHNLFVVEDACEALGSKYSGEFCGTIGDLGCFSFFTSHSITTGEGGVVVTNNEELAGIVKSLRNHGRKGDDPQEKFIFERIGFSAKMNSLEAIIGLGIIDELATHIENRHKSLKKINDILGENLFDEKESEYIVPHALPLLVDSKKARDSLLELLPKIFDIEVRQVFYSIPTQSNAYKFLGEKRGNYPVAEDIGERGIYFPCHQNLSDKEIEKIASAMKKIFKKENNSKNKMENYKNTETCRICGSKDLTEVIRIEPQHLSPTFVKTNENNELSKIKVPMTLVLCDKNKNPGGCGLLQMRETVNPDLLYTNYFYRTAISDTMCKDLMDVVEDVKAHVDFKNGDYVVDIGANDCTMLSYFPHTLNRVGVEPAKNIDWKNTDSSIKIVNDYFSKKALSGIVPDRSVKAITACAMFYDLDDPNSFVEDLKQVLAEDGVICIQLSYLPAMIKNMNFYDICNEHLEYYSLHSLKELMERHGLFIFDAKTNHVNGGSARVFITHKENNYEESASLKELYKEEDEMDLYSVKTYSDFWKKITDLRDIVSGVVKKEISDGNLVLGLGASTKGNMLLQLFGITKEMMPYISERNPDKVGLKTLGTDIELISEEKARELKPFCMLVLPWYFKTEIVKREKEYLDNGGKLLFPMPYPHIISKDGEKKLGEQENIFLKDKKILVTGGAGFLGKFVIKKLLERGAKTENISFPTFEDYDLRKWENCQKVVENKDIVIHLAAKVGGIGFSSKNPGQMFFDTALIGIQLMEAARQAGVKKFVTIGSVCAYPKLAPIPFKEEDIWQGYPEETNAAYGVSKRALLAQAQAYRKQYGFNSIHVVLVNLYGPGDNFDLESSHVIPAIIRKVYEAKKQGKDYIEVWGTGSATREFVHVEDVAEGIVLATEKYNKGEPANLGSGFEISIKDLVLLICQLMDFRGEIRWDKTKPDGQPRRLFDSSRAEKEFGYKAKKDFTEGLKEVILLYENSQK